MRFALPGAARRYGLLLLGGLMAGAAYNTWFRAPRAPVAEPVFRSIQAADTHGTAEADVPQHGVVDIDSQGSLDTSGHAARLLALEPIGEVHREYGEPDRVYRIRMQNGPRAIQHAVAELLDAGPGVHIVQGRAELGELAAGTLVQSHSTVTLRHGEGAPIEARTMQWRMTGGDNPMPGPVALVDDGSTAASDPDPEPEFDDHRDR